MTIEELIQRIDDLVAAVQRIADILDDVTADGRLHISGEAR
jgi:hypothetical protein